MTRPSQRVVAVERDASPGATAAGVLSQPLPRWAKWLLAVLAVAIALAVLPHLSSLHVYEKHFRGGAPDVKLRFEELNPGMDEAALRTHFQGLSLWCMPETSPLGNRVCYSSLGKANGVPALGLALFLRDGRLRHGILHVPWWAHGRVQDGFTATWGQPVPAGTDGSGAAVVRWTMASGQVEMNRKRYLNPLNYSTVLWTASP